MQVIGIDVWNGSQSQIQNYAKGGGRNVTYPLGRNGSSVAVSWGFTGANQSSYAIVDMEGKVAFISSNSVHYSQRYNTYKQTMIDKLTELTTTSGIDDRDGSQPGDFVLQQNSPNPFVSKTAIRFTLNRALQDAPRLVIYDMLGREIRVFEQLQQAAGTHAINWDGRDHAGRSVPRGIYFYALNAGDQRSVKRLIYLGK